MTVEVQFRMDYSFGVKTRTVHWPYDEKAEANDKVKEVLESGANHVTVRDSRTGDFVGLHTMKLGDWVVKDVEE